MSVHPPGYTGCRVFLLLKTGVMLEGDRMRHGAGMISLVCVLVLLSAVPMRADMMPYIPDNFKALGPDLGWFWSDNLSGPAIGFDAVTSLYFFTGSLGMRHVFSKNDGPDFRGNKGLLTVYLEGTVALPFPLGIGVSHNWALDNASGFGVHLYWSIPLPVSEHGYLTFFYRPSWIWLDGNPETAHQLGIGWRFSDVLTRMQKPKWPRHWGDEQPQTNAREK